MSNQLSVYNGVTLVLLFCAPWPIHSTGILVRELRQSQGAGWGGGVAPLHELYGYVPKPNGHPFWSKKGFSVSLPGSHTHTQSSWNVRGLPPPAPEAIT